MVNQTVGNTRRATAGTRLDARVQLAINGEEERLTGGAHIIRINDRGTADVECLRHAGSIRIEIEELLAAGHSTRRVEQQPVGTDEIVGVRCQRCNICRININVGRCLHTVESFTHIKIRTEEQ